MRGWIMRLFGRKPDADEKKRRAMDGFVRLQDTQATSTDLAEKIKEALKRTSEPKVSSDTQ